MAIRSYGSRRIKRFARGKRGVYAAALESRIDRLLDRLRRGDTPAQPEAVGYQVHPLTANLEGYHAVAISGRDRVIFHFEDGDAYDLDVVDYMRARRGESAMHPNLNRVDLRPHPDHDPPELYTIDGAIPPEVLKARVEWLRRTPAHPGDDLTGILERFELEIPEAAARLGVESEDLVAVLEGREPVTVDLALRLEAAGWDTAEGWMRWQVDYDIAQERRKRACEAESIDTTTETAPRASSALTLPA